MAAIRERRSGWMLPCLVLAVMAMAGASFRAAPVTIVAIPWGTATLDAGEPFTVPSTVFLEEGEYRLRVERRGFSTVERTLSVRAGQPQNLLIRLER